VTVAVAERRVRELLESHAAGALSA